MVLNKKSQIFFYGLMLGLLILVLALALAGPIKEVVDNARNETTSYLYTNQTEGTTGLNCSSSEISNFDKGACIVSDLTIFHFIGGLIFIAGAVIVAKFVFS